MESFSKAELFSSKNGKKGIGNGIIFYLSFTFSMRNDTSRPMLPDFTEILYRDRTSCGLLSRRPGFLNFAMLPVQMRCENLVNKSV